MSEHFGLDNLGFLTLTFRDHVTEIREAQRRFNSLRANVLCKRYSAFIAVVERQKSGRLHFHLLVNLGQDIRTGFDFAAIARQDYTSASRTLRSEWAFWRRTAQRYGFGRTELLPVKSTGDAMAEYLGKYIGKHIDRRVPADKRARLVRYSVTARNCSTRFAWAGGRARAWREWLADFSERAELPSEAHLRDKFGRNWGWKLLQAFAVDYELRRGAGSESDPRQAPMSAT